MSVAALGGILWCCHPSWFFASSQYPFPLPKQCWRSVTRPKGQSRSGAGNALPMTLHVRTLGYHGRAMATHHLVFDQEQLASLCRRHGVRRLAVFGSVARGDSGSNSDLDLLVEFLPGQAVGLRFITLQNELSRLFDREVDLSTPGFLSRHFRHQVLVDAVPIYEAA